MKYKKTVSTSIFLIILVVLIYTALAIVGNCESTSISEWTMYMRDMNHSNYVDQNVNIADYTYFCNFTNPFGGVFQGQANSYQDKIIVGSNFGNALFVFNSTNCQQICNYTISDSANTHWIQGSSAIADNKIYFGSLDNKIYSINVTNCALIFNYTSSGQIRSAPAVINGVVYGTSTANAFAINGTNGSLIWSYSGSDTSRTSPLVYNNRVYFGNTAATFYAVNATNGTLIWSLTGSGNFQSTATVVNNILYLGTDTGIFYALNATSGSQLWNKTTGALYFDSAAVVQNNKVYYGGMDHIFHILNATSGVELFNYTTSNDIRSPPLLTKNGLILFGDYDKSLYVLNATNASYITNYSFTTAGIYASPIIIDNELVFSSGTSTYIYKDIVKPKITINFPINLNSYNYRNISLNYTIVDTNTQACWYNVYNTTSLYLTNTTLTNCLNTTINFTVDGNYNITVFSNDTYNNINSSSVFFRISSTNPSVNLINPSNAQWINYNNNIYFNFTVSTSNNISNCQLWGNWSGWHKNQTLTNVSLTGINNFSKLNINDGQYVWNVYCNDTLNNAAFSLTNYTFGIDTIYPYISNFSIPSTTSQSNIPFNFTVNETNINYCSYNLSYDSGGGIFLTYRTNTVIPCSSTTINVGDNYNYRADLSVYDNALNFNYSTTYFNITAAPVSPGGAGGATIFSVVSNLTEVNGFCGDNTCQDGLQNRTDRGESFYNCPEDCARGLEGINLDSLLFNCFSKDETKSKQCIWKTNTTLQVVLIVVIAIFLFLIFSKGKAKQPNFSRKIYYPKKRRR